ncbi:MAG: response regulator [Algicola sp.]|nr:response regulator [Algicola sp.]
MKILFLIFLTLVFNHNALADDKVGSLGSTSSLSPVQLLELIEVKNWTDIKAAEKLSQQALNALKLKPDVNHQARLLNLIAYRKILSGQLDEPYKDAVAARKLAIGANNLKEEAESYRHEATILVLAGVPADSLALYIKALNLHQKINSNKVFDTLQGMSLPYMLLGDMDKYLEYGYKLLERPEAKAQSREQGLAFYTLGYGLLQLDRIDEAREYLEKSAAIFSPMKVLYTSSVYRVLAELEYRTKRYDNALLILEQSDRLAKQNNYEMNSWSHLLLKTQIFRDTGRIEEATGLLLQIIEKIGDKDDQNNLRVAYQQLAGIYQNQGKFEGALLAYQKFKSLSDSVLDESSTNKMAFFQTRFESEQKEQQIEVLKNKHQMQVLETQQQQENSTLRGYVILMAAVLLISSLLVLHRSIRVREKLTQYADELQQASKAKSEFLANMSHEIRTPMNAILGMSLLALRTSLTVQQQDYLNKINSSAKLLLQVINDILDFSKIEAGKLDIEKVVFSFDEVLQNVSNFTSEQAELKNIELIFSVAENLPSRLHGDPLRLGQVLTNLCSNAVKFTQHGEVIVSCSYTTDAKSGHTMNVTVKDTGIGMSKAQQDKLFQSFTQADASTTRRFGGTGLGLAISQQLVTMMGGHIYVDSEFGKGSTFSFSIPVENADDTAPMPELPKSLQNLRVLVVDDNENARAIMHSILTDAGLSVSMAQDGKKALKVLQQAQDIGHPFELVLMDWRMPQMNGFEAAKLINQHQLLENIPAVLMVTSYGRDEVKRMDKDNVLSGYITKPITATALLESIKTALGVGGSALNEQPKSVEQAALKHEQDEQLIKQVKNISGARILLVEDNDFNQQVALELLQQAGMIVDIAVNGKEAVEAARHNDRYDLVFMDIQMPVMDGYQATRTLRSFEEFTDLPIVAMTAHAMQGERERCDEAGMNDYLCKPIEPELLYQMLVSRIQPTDRQPVEITLVADRGLFESTISEGDVVLPSVLDGIDIRLGLKRTGNKPCLYIELANTYLKQYENTRQQFKFMLIQKDYEAVNRLAHIMQAGAGSLGAERLRKNLIKVVELADNKQLTSPQMVDLYREIEKVFESVKLLPSLNGAKVEPKTVDGNRVIDIVAVRQLLPMLQRSLTEGSFDAKIQLGELVAALRGHHGQTTLIMIELVNDYEFLPAAQLLEKLTTELNEDIGIDSRAY